MNNTSISNRTKKINEIQKIINELTSESEEKLVRFCFDKGHSIADIATALGTSRTVIYSKYPDLKERKRK